MCHADHEYCSDICIVNEAVSCIVIYSLRLSLNFKVPVQVKVKRRADDQKFLAQVLAIGTDCDIALLTVEDEAFWEGVTPLELGPLPTLQVSPQLSNS